MSLNNGADNAVWAIIKLADSNISQFLIILSFHLMK